MVLEKGQVEALKSIAGCIQKLPDHGVTPKEVARAFLGSERPKPMEALTCAATLRLALGSLAMVLQVVSLLAGTAQAATTMADEVQRAMKRSRE
jgi:hypothetical protein